MKTQTGKKLKTQTLLHDIDGCLCDWNSGFRALLESLHGVKQLTTWEHALKRWDWHRALGYTNREINDAWEKVDWDWWFGLAPLPGAVEALHSITDFQSGLERLNPDFHTYFVTGRHAKERHATADWLQSQRACCPSVICTSRKAKLAEAFALDGPVAAIEDKPSMIIEYAASAKVNPILIIDQPYNRPEVLDDPALYAHCEVIRCATAFNALEVLVQHWGLKIEKPQEAKPAEAAEDSWCVADFADTADKNERV